MKLALSAPTMASSIPFSAPISPTSTDSASSSLSSSTSSLTSPISLQSASLASCAATPSPPPLLSGGARYKLQRVIGRGSFGIVSLCEDLLDHHTPRHSYVMKHISLQSQSADSVTALQEVRLLKALTHPFIVRYHDSWVDREAGALWIVCHYCAGGDLASLIAQRAAAPVTTPASSRYFPEGAVLDWFIELCLALRYCHDRKLLHRDIKTQNIFLTQHHTCKLGDFGIARVLTATREMASSVVGTPYALAPEVCESKAYSYAADVWALGCVLYEMCSLRRPFEAENLLGLVWKIVHCQPREITECGYSDELRRLVSAMLHKDSSKRPSIKEILMLPFIQQRVPIIVERMKQRKLEKRSKQKRKE